MSVEGDMKFASKIVFDLDDENPSSRQALQHRNAKNNAYSDVENYPDPFAHFPGHLVGTPHF